LAAKMARMQTVHVHDEEYYMSLDKRIAKDIDVDLSEAIVRMTKATTAYQASIQVGAHLMNTSLLNFL
jgi:flagellin-like hook-associated protein FlgL